MSYMLVSSCSDEDIEEQFCRSAFSNNSNILRFKLFFVFDTLDAMMLNRLFVYGDTLYLKYAFVAFISNDNNLLIIVFFIKNDVSKMQFNRAQYNYSLIIQFNKITKQQIQQ